MQTILRLPTQSFGGLGLSLLATGEFLADFGRDGVVLGTFGQKPALMAVAATGDATQALVRAAGGLGGNQAQIGHELARVLEAVNIAQLTDSDHGSDQLETAEGHESLHRGFEPPVFQESEHGSFNALDSIMSGVDALEVFFENGLHGRVWQNQLAQVTHVRLTPISFALVTEAVAQEKAFETMTATAMVIDGIGASATEVANGLVGGFGDVDGGQFAGTQQTGQAAGIAFVGLERRTGLFGNEGRGGDQAGDFELFEPARDTEPTGTSFISGLQDGVGMGFADPVNSLFQGLEVIGDSAKDADLAGAARFGDGDDDGVLMDIKTEV